ncbi:MAG: AraC family transcriptional regulator [Prevotella sp.]|nr:AraC family transcriptional regulator [Prevotella sp.]
MEKEKGIVLLSSLDGLMDRERGEYITHALCLEGRCEIDFNDQTFVFCKGDSMIIRAYKLVTAVRVSDDFRVRVIDVTPQFVENCTPNNNYGIRGSLSLFRNPIMPLTEEEFRQCSEDFDCVEERYENTAHRFYRDVLMCAVEMLFLDFFDFHARINGFEEISSMTAGIMARFLQMLARGDYRMQREVTYYASELCVTPKYLSEVCKKVSGFSANYWINRYTVMELQRLLRDRSLTLTEIADRFSFSSQAYFSRYVQHYLGAPPSALKA